MVIGPLGPILILLVLATIIVAAVIVRLARGQGLPPMRSPRKKPPHDDTRPQ